MRWRNHAPITRSASRGGSRTQVFLVRNRRDARPNAAISGASGIEQRTGTSTRKHIDNGQDQGNRLSPTGQNAAVAPQPKPISPVQQQVKRRNTKYSQVMNNFCILHLLTNHQIETHKVPFNRGVHLMVT